MASAWGDALTSMSESMKRREDIKRQDKLQAEAKVEHDRQFKLMMDQFLAQKDQTARSNKMEDARVASSNIVPDESGSAGSLSLDDPRLKAVLGTPYDRSSQGMSLPSRSTTFTEGVQAPGDPTSQPGQRVAPPQTAMNAPKPTGKFVWNPSWEQQQSIDTRNEHVADVQQQQGFLSSERKATEGFQQGQTASAQKFQAEQQQKQINATYGQIKMQLGNKLSPQQEIAMRTFDVMLAHQPKPGFDGTVDPTEWANWLNMAKGPMTALGMNVPGGPTTPGGPSMPPPPGMEPAASHESIGARISSLMPDHVPDVSRFLGSPKDNLDQYPAPSTGQLSWEDIDRIMRQKFPNTGNWNPTTMGRDIRNPRR